MTAKSPAKAKKPGKPAAKPVKATAKAAQTSKSGKKPTPAAAAKSADKKKKPVAAKPVKATAKAAPAKTKKTMKPASKPATKTVAKPATKPATKSAAKPVAKPKEANKGAKPSAKPEKETAADKKAKLAKDAKEAKAAQPGKKPSEKPVPTNVAAPAAKATRKVLDKPLLVSPAPEVNVRKEYVPITASAPARETTAKLPPVNAALKDAWKKKKGIDLSEDELLAMPDTEYMNERQLDFFRLRLQNMQHDLIKHADETTEHLREDTLTVPDPADRATIEEEHALELRTRDRERKLLKKIQQAIVMIDNGEYGFCEETGEPIGVRRLLARPTATLSLEAQQRRELKQKLYGD